MIKYDEIDDMTKNSINTILERNGIVSHDFRGKKLLIYEDDFFGNLQNCCKIYNKRELC